MSLWNEHHDGMTSEGSQTAVSIDSKIHDLVNQLAVRENIFEVETLLHSSVGAACAEFRIRRGLQRRLEEKIARKGL